MKKEKKKYLEFQFDFCMGNIKILLKYSIYLNIKSLVKGLMFQNKVFYKLNSNIFEETNTYKIHFIKTLKTF